jgi:ubiquinone/menaquinone biosynthesis C-methylase UbiE
MERVPEPELMDEEEQARAYSEADFQAPHDRFVDLFLASFPEGEGPGKGPILDLGCGPADVTVRIAARCPDAVVHGVDGSEAMLRHGRARVEAAGLSSRIVLAKALLPREAPPASAYPVVVSNSLLHHLHDPSTLWATVKRYAAPGARVFIMDLLRPPTGNDVERLVQEHARGEPEVLVRDFRASLFAAFTIQEVRAQLRAAGLIKLHVEAVSDRHLTIAGRL